MHILLTNDDGPLNDKASPYIKYLVDEINSSTDWKLSIVVPNQQRSWIGKAHFAGKSLTPSYIYTNDSTATPNQQVNAFDGPFTNPQPQLKSSQEWCLVDSTPAACTDLGIYHLNSFDQPIDLVISGPNLAGFDKQDTVYDKIRTITGELFRAATSVDKINFQPLPNAVEIYGVDFLVNDDLEVKLLEVNAYPDFKQTGDDLKDLIFELFDRVVNEAVLPLVTNEEKHTTESNLDLVYLYE
ncbi:hypothetical protein QCA50_015721 [Cerrena zonata]|uniref:Survival protein SurE-like phosphatase/nucleotidase domain-containing protein n=1 Tax=Cerrena zonata TaxID=2478898 RepID=A0AAW0FUW3_9APHY